MMNLISDLTARDLGGYHAVLAVHAEGSIEAEKMQILRSLRRADEPLAYARRLAGLDLTRPVAFSSCDELHRSGHHLASRERRAGAAVTPVAPAPRALEPAAPRLEPAGGGQAVEGRRQVADGAAGAQDELIEGDRLPVEGVEHRPVARRRRRPVVAGRRRRRPGREAERHEDVGGVADHRRTRRRGGRLVPAEAGLVTGPGTAMTATSRAMAHVDGVQRAAPLLGLDHDHDLGQGGDQPVAGREVPRQRRRARAGTR